jgi:hypothetical protein
VAGGVALVAIAALILTLWMSSHSASPAAPADAESQAIEKKPDSNVDTPVKTEEPRPREEAAVPLSRAPKPEPRPDAQDAPALGSGLETSPSAGACETYGTSVQFVNNPAEAARQARRQDKLVFLLHVSGNFEDAKFT